MNDRRYKTKSRRQFESRLYHLGSHLDFLRICFITNEVEVIEKVWNALKHRIDLGRIYIT